VVVWDEVQTCIYPADATDTISCSSKSRLVLTFLVLPFWYLLTRVVPDRFQQSSKTVVCMCVPEPSVCLSICRSLRKLYCGEMADWIRMLFGVVSGVGRGMGVLDGGSDRRRVIGSFGGECGASHHNQWGLCCVVVRKCVIFTAIELSFGVVSGVGPGIDVLDGGHSTSPRASRGRCCFGDFSAFASPLV